MLLYIKKTHLLLYNLHVDLVHFLALFLGGDGVGGWGGVGGGEYGGLYGGVAGGSGSGGGLGTSSYGLKMSSNSCR